MIALVESLTRLYSQDLMTVEQAKQYVQWCVTNQKLDYLVQDVLRLDSIEKASPKLDHPRYTFILSKQGTLGGVPDTGTQLVLGPLSYKLKYPPIKIEGFYKPKKQVPIGSTILISLGTTLLGFTVGSLVN